MKVAVFISGRGSNLKAILEAEGRNELGKAEIALVVTNNPIAGGLKHAENYDKKIVILDSKNFTDKDEYDNELKQLMVKNEIELIVLAGYMRILTTSFVDYFEKKIINIHPSLLPAFPGLDVHEKVLDYGVKFSGCTVHFVNTEIDAGPIISQEVVEVLDDDSPETLAERILAEEHKLLPRVIKNISESKIIMINRKVRIL
ncbi:MAG: phosphoribosylglycinamide formyltransferase [Candidatus Heimdallarchaeota archaeon]|nr:phosphoribosylglycinamide formyltransferase [Candidatus Heimdallarchaeota archaeon]